MDCKHGLKHQFAVNLPADDAISVPVQKHNGSGVSFHPGKRWCRMLLVYVPLPEHHYDIRPRCCSFLPASRTSPSKSMSGQGALERSSPSTMPLLRS